MSIAQSTYYRRSLNIKNFSEMERKDTLNAQKRRTCSKREKKVNTWKAGRKGKPLDFLATFTDET